MQQTRRYCTYHFIVQASVDGKNIGQSRNETSFGDVIVKFLTLSTVALNGLFGQDGIGKQLDKTNKRIVIATIWLA